MAFFKALNPFTEVPGKELSLQDHLIEYIDNDISIGSTLELFWGNHYEGNLKKGILDLLILPLLSRELINHSIKETEKASEALTGTLAFLIAMPVEALRFVVAVGLTILSIPIMATIWFLKTSMSESNQISEAQYPIIPVGFF